MADDDGYGVVVCNMTSPDGDLRPLVKFQGDNFGRAENNDITMFIGQFENF